MSPPTNDWRQRRTEHPFFYAEIVTDISQHGTHNDKLNAK